jgi:hypothetical protein
VLSFWPSDAVLVATQAGLVCGPRPKLPRPLLGLRTRAWGWLMPVSLGGTIGLLAVAPGFAIGFAWAAVIGVPVLAVPALASTLPLGAARRLGPVRAGVAALAGAGVLLTAAWILHGHLWGQAAAVALTALSACTLASYLAGLATVPLLKVGIVAMAVLDAVLVFGQLLEGPNRALVAASPGAHLPHLQAAVFGTAVIGYGDLFIAAVLGNVIATHERPRSGPTRWRAALLVLACAAAFDVLFLAVDVLPATVPVAIAMLLIEPWRGAARRGRPCE